MLNAFLSSWTLFIGISMIMLGNGLQGSLLGVRASLEGFSTTTTGLVMTGYFVGFLVGSLLVPRWVRNVGHIRVFAALASLASVSVLAHAVFLTPWVWMLMRLMTGLSYAGLYIVAESWLNERASNETRGQLLSLYMITTYGGVAGGQVLLNVSAPDSFVLFVLASALISLALVPMTLSVTAAPVLQAPKLVGIKELYRASPLGVFGSFVVGITNGIWFGMAAVYATQIGMTLDELALFLVSGYIGAILLQWPIGWCSDRYDRRLVLTVVALLAALGVLAAILFSAGPNRIPLYLITLIFAGLMLSLYSLCIAHTNDHLQPDQMVGASGTLVLIGGIGASSGPMLASVMMNRIGPQGFFWSLAGLLAGIGLFAIFRMTRRRALPLAAQGSYLADTPLSSLYVAEIAAEQAAEKQSETGA